MAFPLKANLNQGNQKRQAIFCGPSKKFKKTKTMRLNT